MSYKFLLKVCYQSNCVNSSILVSPKLSNTPCSPNPCLNGGSCILVNQFYFCKCSPRFTDANCGTQLNSSIPTTQEPRIQGLVAIQRNQRL